MCGGFTCSKNTLIGLNVIYILVGFLLIGVASYGKSTAVITSLPIIGWIVACGVFLMLIAIVGLVGSIKHHQVMLFFYMIILFLIFLVQFSVACACLTVSEETEKTIMKKAWNTVDNETIISFEKTLGCCAFDNQSDSTQVIGCDQVPVCNEGKEDTFSCPTCFEKIQPKISSAFSSAGGLGLFFSFTELLGVVSSYKFRVHIRDSGMMA